MKWVCWKCFRWRVSIGGVREISICLLVMVYIVWCLEFFFLFVDGLFVVVFFGLFLKRWENISKNYVLVFFEFFCLGFYVLLMKEEGDVD